MLTSNGPLKTRVYAKLLIGERNKTTTLEMYGDFFFVVVVVIMIGNFFFIVVIMIGFYWVRCREAKAV